MSRAHVLLVENDPDLARDMTAALSSLDVTAEVAPTARDALAQPGDAAIDVAVLDVPLPEPDGVDLVGQVSRQWPDAETVVMTRPFTAERLRERVRLALERRTSRRDQLRDGRIAAVNTLAAGLAHELRNPLNSALLQLARAERRALALGQGGTDATALRGHIAAGVDELRRLARILTDFQACLATLPVARREVEAEELCRVMVDDIVPMAGEHQVAIAVELEAGLPVVRVDVDGLRRALHHLTRNAVEALGEGGTLTVRARRGHAGLELDVEDTGPGVPDPTSIFDPFFTTKPTGTGLGLTIANRTVADHGGAIRVASRPGRTCFTVELPIGGAPR